MSRGAILAIAVAVAVVAGAVAAAVVGQGLGGTAGTEPGPGGSPGERPGGDGEKGPGQDGYAPQERVWQRSGPFEIDREEYVLGEKIFVRISELGPSEKGQIAFMRPLNQTHYSVYITIPFDAQNKPEFNYYVDPQVSRTKGICTADDLVGEWAVVFRGTDHPSLKFEITDRVLPGSEEHFAPVC